MRRGGSDILHNRCATPDALEPESFPPPKGAATTQAFGHGWQVASAAEAVELLVALNAALKRCATQKLSRQIAALPRAFLPPQIAVLPKAFATQSRCAPKGSVGITRFPNRIVSIDFVAEN